MSVHYTHRQNALKPTIKWQVEANGLSWSDDDGAKGVIKPEDISRVRLRYEPTRVAPHRVGLHFLAPEHLAITNSHYVGVLNFEHKPQEFENFVIAFHKMFAPNTKTKFNLGSTKSGWIFNIVMTIFIVAMLLLLAPLISLMGIGSGGTNIFRIVLILVFLPTLFKVVFKNKPSSYRPDNIPIDILH